MDRFIDIIGASLIFGVISGLRKGRAAAPKIRISPFKKGDETLFQFTSLFEKKALHTNLNAGDAAEHIASLLKEDYTQAVFFTAGADYYANSLGKLKIQKKPPTKKDEPVSSHNRKKSYILDEGIPHDFLVSLGVMNDSGQVFKGKFDKYKQLNKYLELIRSYIPSPPDRPVRIIDFGCGKAYLTFAVYYYLTAIKKQSCKITGLDLKEDVITFCGSVRDTLGYTGLDFQIGDISDYDSNDSVDMVISLHACDTATDLAISKAVHWNSPVIIAVPCCQHELFPQISASEQLPLMKHGILKERTASLVTDSLRAQLLEAVGYSADVVEFIDMEHTPKNIMLRAEKKAPSPAAFDDYLRFKEYWNVRPLLEELLRDRLPGPDK
jgi:SAM-dependent methyltransferase